MPVPTDFLDGRPDDVLLNGLRRAVWTVLYGLLIRRFWGQVPGSAQQNPGHNPAANTGDRRFGGSADPKSLDRLTGDLRYEFEVLVEVEQGELSQLSRRCDQ